jgi:hypothetical protein
LPAAPLDRDILRQVPRPAAVDHRTTEELMQLTLSDNDARILRDLLHDYLPDLRREAAGTDLAARDLRHELAQREELCEWLLAELDRRVLRGTVGTT